MKINLIVIRSANQEISKDFYESVLGMSFSIEKHGNGPEHYCAEFEEFVFEIYPLNKNSTSGLRIGIKPDNFEDIFKRLKDIQYKYSDKVAYILLEDPDGHVLELWR